VRDENKGGAGARPTRGKMHKQKINWGLEYGFGVFYFPVLQGRLGLSSSS